MSRGADVAARGAGQQGDEVEGAGKESDPHTRRDALVVLRGGGDLGTGVGHRLFRAGFRVVVLECDAPKAVRRRVAFAQAVYSGDVTVEGVTARRVGQDEAVAAVAGASAQWVPVIVDPEGESLARLRPAVIVDARMAKRNLGTSRDDAPLTVALGPGFEAGRDVDLVVETKRGHALGTVIEKGAALPNTGVPGEVGGATVERLLVAPVDGLFQATRSIGDIVRKDERVAVVSGEPVVASTAGIVRGLLADGLRVSRGEKVGDVDPRGSEIDPGAISDKARAIGGAVLEALLSRGMLPGPTRPR